MPRAFTSLFITTALAISLAACSPTKVASHDTQMKSVVASQSFDSTEAALRTALDSSGLKLFTVIDHGQGAKSIGADIGRSKLFIFGNPKSGTPLMQADPTLGLHLPMKILLHEQGSDVHLHRSDIIATIRAHGVTDQEARLEKISETLDSIMKEAAMP